MKIDYLLLLLLFLASCAPKDSPKSNERFVVSAADKVLQDSIISEHLENGAWQHGLYSKEWQSEIDKGLEKDSTIAYLWQQKAMPLFKQGKYELGMRYLDKAVKFDTNNEWQEYRAFMKCIFSKTYKDAILDFEACKVKSGNSYVMDHSYDFYIALSKIMLNEYTEAEQLLTNEIARQLKAQGEEWIHHLDLFYLGIAKYELGKYNEAIEVFERAIKLDPNFSELYYYKAECMAHLGEREEGKKVLAEARRLGKEGSSVSEDNSIYERYPYQIRWELWE